MSREQRERLEELQRELRELRAQNPIDKAIISQERKALEQDLRELDSRVKALEGQVHRERQAPTRINQVSSSVFALLLMPLYGSLWCMLTTLLLTNEQPGLVFVLHIVAGSVLTFLSSRPVKK